MIAQKLGRTVGELEGTLSQIEFIEWGAFFEIKNEAKKKAIEEAKRGR